MDVKQACTNFVQRWFAPGKARRFTELCATRKGQRNVLAGLYHEFEPAVRPGTVHCGGYDSLWSSPCFIFHEPLGFGVEAASVREAYDQLSVEDGWLILLCGGSAGVHRPEARWDDEKLIGQHNHCSQRRLAASVPHSRSASSARRGCVLSLGVTLDDATQLTHNT